MNIVEKAIEQIKKDIIYGDLTALEELLNYTDIDILKAYLPEEVEYETNK